MGYKLEMYSCHFCRHVLLFVFFFSLFIPAALTVAVRNLLCIADCYSAYMFRYVCKTLSDSQLYVLGYPNLSVVLNSFLKHFLCSKH